MTHEFDFRVEVRTFDHSFGTIDREGGDICFAQVAQSDPRLFPDLRAANEHRVRATERLAACWNAMVGLNPDAVADVVAALEPFAKAGGLLVKAGDSGKFWAYRPAGGDEYGITGTHLLDARNALARIRGEG